MRREELRALGALAGDAAAGIATQAREVHEGIAARVFGGLGPTAAPVRVAHDQISTRAYAAASALTGALVRGGAAAASVARREDAPSVTDAPVAAWPWAPSTACGATGCTAMTARSRRRWRCARADAT